MGRTQGYADFGATPPSRMLKDRHDARVATWVSH
jgi:hypothetical protein